MVETVDSSAAGRVTALLGVGRRVENAGRGPGVTACHQAAWPREDGGGPLLVMDIYEHSYHLDYGANAKGYVDAFFANLRSDAVDRRLLATAGRRNGEEMT